jgi:hypothetical protein
MLAKRLATAMAGVGLVLLLGAAPTFAAASATPVGNFFIADRGPGAWVGGTLLSDGTARGGGEFAFQAAPGTEEVAKIQPVSWTKLSPTSVLLCFNITGVQGPAFPIGTTVTQCFPLDVTGAAGHPGAFFGDQGTFYKLNLF